MARRGMMGKERVTAFSDGVIAIIITIMVLDLKTPASGDISALRPLLPVFLGYILSFVYVGIYWNNHHHLLRRHALTSAVRSCGLNAPSPVVAIAHPRYSPSGWAKNWT